MQTRDEHLQWCKERALKYVNNGNGRDAISSMLSDLSKHPDTESLLHIGGMLMMCVNTNDMEDVRHFVDGFN